MKEMLTADKFGISTHGHILMWLSHNQKEIYNYIEKEFKEINQKLDFIVERLNKNLNL